jgi:hypothetical protein
VTSLTRAGDMAMPRLSPMVGTRVAASVAVEAGKSGGIAIS